MKKLKISLALVSFLLAGAWQCRAQEVEYQGYTCNPTTCFVEATGVGFWSSGISTKGDWLQKGGVRHFYKSAHTGISSMGCTVSVTIESVGYETSHAVFGVGVVAESVATQVGVTLLEGQMVRYFNNSSGWTRPKPEVPCI